MEKQFPFNIEAEDQSWWDKHPSWPWIALVLMAVFEIAMRNL